MNKLTNYTEFQNESLRDKMTPKSNEEIIDAIVDLDIPRKEALKVIERIKKDDKLKDIIEDVLDTMKEMKNLSSLEKLTLIYENEMIELFDKSYLSNLLRKSIKDKHNRIKKLTDDIFVLSHNNEYILFNVKTYNYMSVGYSGKEYIEKSLKILL